MHKLALLLALPLAAQIAPVPDKFFFDEGKVRVLILTGRNNHDWRVTNPFLREVLQGTGRFDVRVTEEPSGLTAETLRPYDVLISNYCGPRWGVQAEKAVADFVKGGNGLVVVHAGSYPFGETAVLSERMGRTGVYQKPWHEWGLMVGATWSDAEPKTGHGPRDAFDVVIEDKAHPVTAGLAERFVTSDELYRNFRLKPGIHVLAQGREKPLIWTTAYGKGRVFHTALGHDLDAMQTPGFVATYARGTEWAATGAVTLPAKIDTNPKNANAVRVLLVSGGHDHESSFYGVFEKWRDVRVNVDPHPVAFRKDLRKDYDVLVLYDTIQVDQLPEKARQNLKDFVEAGKGLVVLHHAIVDFSAWDWWWKEVVGGRYVLKAEPEYPASKYLHDVEMVVTPKAGHPITKGLPQMRLYDETYKQVWHRPDVQVLLTTDHATSDLDIGWVSPYAKSRVVYLQPGHGRESHELPWFRTLVHRTILWTAGR